MIIGNNRKLNFEIIIDDNDLKNNGFEKVSINNNDIIISFVADSSKLPILSKFKIDDLTGTLKSLHKELVNRGINKQSVQRLEIFLSEKLITQKQKELETQKEEDSAPETDAQKILHLRQTHRRF
jgi:hypothetical protein